jgi:glycosyltransferase involved in cell wall biosynthesis
LSAPQITIVGYPFQPTGMAEHARSTFRALQAVGVTPRLLDVGQQGAAVDPDLAANFASHLTSTLGSGVNIFGVNGDEAARVIAGLDEAAFAAGYNIAYPAWELARYPAEWARVLERFDEVWAPSSFVQRALADAVSRPVHRMPLPVDLQLTSFLGRRHFGIPEDAFVVLFFFDLLSFATRKNPAAVLKAFEILASRRPDAEILCVIKARGGGGDGAIQAELEARVASLRGGAMLVTGDLSDNETKNLVRNCDVFVSLHRSEGFGRGMAEAMAFGRPAIATGYSGNVDFMVAGTSLLVDYQLIPVAPDAYPHGEGQVWAEPSPEHAAALIEQLLDDPVEARAMGARGRAHVEKTLSLKAAGRRIQARLKAIGRR